MATLNKEKDNGSVNLIELFKYLFSHWPLFILSAGICLGIAAYKYAKTDFIYFRQATVMIKNPSNNGQAAGFDKYNNLINKVNVSNEILQFRSSKILQQAIDRTNANISYQYKMRGLRNMELYNRSPFIATFGDESKNFSLSFTVKLNDKNSAEISRVNGNETGETMIAAMNDTIVLAENTLSMKLRKSILSPLRNLSNR